VRAVLDTNLLVSGLRSPHGTTGRVVELLLAGQLVLLADDRILAEYADVLARPKFGFRPEDVMGILDSLRATTERVTAAPLGVALRDPGDLPFLEVAAAGGADALVTGNTRDCKRTRGRHVAPVMTPAQFLAMLAGAQ
jgi:putative PIN family toxin of toxin-antitoxin system